MWKGERSFFGLNETKPELMLVLGDVVVISYRMCGGAIPPPSTTTFGCGLRAFDLDRQSVALQNMLVTCSVEEFIAEFQEVRRQKPNKKKQTGSYIPYCRYWSQLRFLFGARLPEGCR